MIELLVQPLGDAFFICALVALACELTAWMQMLALPVEPARRELRAERDQADVAAGRRGGRELGVDGVIRRVLEGGRSADLARTILDGLDTRDGASPEEVEHGRPVVRRGIAQHERDARALGARPRMTPEAVIVHYAGASEKVRADKMVRLLRAKVLLIKRARAPYQGLWTLPGGGLEQRDGDWVARMPASSFVFDAEHAGEAGDQGALAGLPGSHHDDDRRHLQGPLQ